MTLSTRLSGGVKVENLFGAMCPQNLKIWNKYLHGSFGINRIDNINPPGVRLALREFDMQFNGRSINVSIARVVKRERRKKTCLLQTK